LQEKELIEILKRDPDSGIELIFRQYYNIVCQKIYRIIPDHTITEDIAQEIFIELWNKRSSLEITKSISAYLNKMAVSRSLNYIRDQKKHRHSGEDALQSVKNKQSDIQSIMQAEELADKIKLSIESLPERCRRVFILSRYEKMSHREISEKLGISTKTVENQITKALNVMRQSIFPTGNR
jgi:RNA polymerase sigma-70 factor (ECF subfamily)